MTIYTMQPRTFACRSFLRNWRILAAAAITVMAMGAPQPCDAQDEQQAQPAAQAADDQGGAAAPDNAAAENDDGGNNNGAGANNGAGNGASGDQQAVGQPESYLSFFFRSLGWKYTVAFFILSFSLVAMLISAFIASRKEAVLPTTLVEGFELLLNEKKYQEAYDLAKADESFLGRVLAAGMARLSNGYGQAQEAMREMSEEEVMKIEHRLSYIALIGAISPMVGLLGTVDGMVAAFSVIATTTTTPSPKELAMNICTALITTLVGLWLAIPAIAVHGFLRNRFQRLALEVSLASGQLLGRFENVPTKK